MALNKAKTINRPDGTTVTGSYWKITKEVIDKQKLSVTWTLSLFLSQTVADNSGSQTLAPDWTH